MEELFEIINTLKRLLPTLIPLKGKQLVPIKAIVYDNQDPENRRRIRVYDPLVGSLYPSEFIEPLRTTRSHDPMVPLPGQTVILTYLNGNPDEPLYTLYHNDPNPSRPKEDAINDSWSDVDGNDDYHVGRNQKQSVKGNRDRLVEGLEVIKVKKDRNKTVEGNESNRIVKNYTLSSGKEVLIKNDANAKVTLTELGKEIHQLPLSGGLYVDIGPHRVVEIDLINNKLKLFSPVDIEIEAPNVRFNTSGKVKINGRNIMCVSGKDSDNDTMTQDGQ